MITTDNMYIKQNKLIELEFRKNKKPYSNTTIYQ